MLRLSVQTDIRAVLPAIQAPSLVIARAQDSLFPPSHGRYVAGQIPNARFVETDAFGSVGLGLALDARRKFA